MESSSVEKYVIVSCYLIPHLENHLQSFFIEIYQQHLDKTWINSPQQGVEFSTGIGRNIWLTGSRRQKLLLETGNVALWDARLLNHVIQKLSDKFQLKPSDKMKLEEFAALKCEILRNHQATLSKEKFAQIVKIVKGVVTQFKGSIKQIKTIKQLKEHDNTEDLSAGDCLKKKGNSLFQKGEMDKAVETYTQGLKTLPLGKSLEGTSYSNKSAALLEMGKSLEENDLLILALDDAKNAVELRPIWLKSHFRLGCAYQSLKKYEKAAKHFTIALEIGQDESKKELMPYLVECAKNITKVIPLQAKYFEDLERYLHEEMANDTTNKKSASHKNYWQGIKYMIGHEEGQNYDLAMDLLHKAGNQGNAQALYDIAMMYKFGVGVKKDLKKMLKYLNQAAIKKPNKEDCSNTGVQVAENELGRVYEKGTGTSRNLETAVKWYTKAAHHGSKNAASTLIKFYSEGRGVEKSELEAACFRSMNDNLKTNDSIEPKNSESQPSKSSQKKFLKNSQNHESHKLKKTKLDYKKNQKKVSKPKAAMSLKKDNLMVNTEKFYCDDIIITKEKDPTAKQQHRPHFKYYKCPYDLEMLKYYEQKGFKTATQLKKLAPNFVRARQLLDDFDPSNFYTILHEVAECFRLSVTLDFHPSMLRMRNELILKMGEWNYHIEVNSPFRRLLDSQFDKDCYVLTAVYLFKNDEYSELVNLLEKCVKRHPDELFFYVLLSLTFYFLPDMNRGMVIVQSALRKWPNHHEFHYCRFLLLCTPESYLLINGDTLTERKKEACKNFISTAPKDHTKRPLVYRLMAKRFSLELDNWVEDAMYEKLYAEAKKNLLPGLSVRTDVPPFLKEEIRDECYWINKKEKTELEDPHRVRAITQHRRWVHVLGNMGENMELILFMSVNVLGMQYGPKSSLTELEPIVLREIDKVDIYIGRTLSCFIIEEPIFGLPSVHLIVEDVNRDVARVCIYNIRQNDKVKTKLGVGKQITILNPLFKFATDGYGVIRIDEAESIIFERDAGMDRCRFCGVNGEGFKKCGKCRKAMYCCKKCQEKDWILMKHKLICF